MYKFLRLIPGSAIAILLFYTSALATPAPAAVNIVQNSTKEKLTAETKNAVDSTRNLTDSPEIILEQIEQYNHDNDQPHPLGQVTNVSQLRDVQPGDWAAQALRDLIERYGVIVGYPNGTFRGNRALTRYEFAAALLNTLDQINLLIQRRGNSLPSADLNTLEQLTNEFILELSLARGEVDAVTARTIDLELTQFSPTTKLAGEVIMGVAGIVTNNNNTTILGHRTRLNLTTSFTGKDLLQTRLQAEGLGVLEDRLSTPEGELAFTGATDSNLQIDQLLYHFPIGSRTQVVIAANAGEADDFTNTINPNLDGDGATGAVSRFATRPPIYNLVSGTGVGVQHTFNDNLEFSLGYLAGNGHNPNSSNGLFNGAYGAIAQLVYQPSERATIGLTYVHAYNQDLQTGSNNANLFNQLELPVVSNSYGLATSVQISPRLVLGGWVGYTAARVIDTGNANIWNWAVTLAFPDLGKMGNLAGFIIGMEPQVTQTDSGLRGRRIIDDPSTSLHLEAFYQYQLSDNIAITPAIIWLTSPNHNSVNDDIVIGTLRTTFRF